MSRFVFLPMYHPENVERFQNTVGEIAEESSPEERIEKNVEDHPEFLAEMMNDMRKLKDTSGENSLLSPEDLEDLNRCLEPHDWKLLACMWLYEPKTLFRHSLSTFKIASRKFKRVFLLNGKSIAGFDITLGEEIGQEASVAVREFLRACVLHDVGKITIALSVLENSVQDSESFEFLVQQMVSEDSADRNRAAKILMRLSSHHDESEGSAEASSGEVVRGVEENDSLEGKMQKARASVEALLDGRRMNMFMPIKDLFHIEYRKKRASKPADQEVDILEESWVSEQVRALEQGGFSGDMTLKSILDTHQTRSERILMNHGDYFSALFAGHHHPRPDVLAGVRGEVVATGANEHAGESQALMREFFEKIGNHAQATQEKTLTHRRKHQDDAHVMRVAPVIIRFCDTLDALTDPTRPYKRGMALEEALDSIRNDSQRDPEEFSSAVVALCLFDEIAHDLSYEKPLSIDNFNEKADAQGMTLGEVLREWIARIEVSRGIMAREKAERISRFMAGEIGQMLGKMEESVEMIGNALASLPGKDDSSPVH